MSETTHQTTLQFDPGKTEFEAYLGTQLNLVGCELRDVGAELNIVYPRIQRQFARIRNKYFRNDKGPVLRVAHNAQYTIFLYRLARCAFESDNRSLADKIYALLRIVSSADLYYEVELPALWLCDHPLGSVIGRAQFASTATLVFSQNCNVGNNRGIYPRIESNLHMYAGSSLLGDTLVRGNVVLSNGACAIDAGELNDCLVFGRSPNLTTKPLTREQFRKLSPLVFD